MICCKLLAQSKSLKKKSYLEKGSSIIPPANYTYPLKPPQHTTQGGGLDEQTPRILYIRIVNISSLVVIACILNEFRGHKLLNDALNVPTSITLKLKKEMNHLLLLDALIDDDSGLNIELETLRRFGG
jgi:hypothetical protein